MLKEKLLNKIKEKDVQLVVLGLGYVGLPTITVLANLGFQVTGVDINTNIINGITQGISHTKEPGIEKILTKNLHQGNLKVTENPQVIANADIVIICVQTPVNNNGKPNLTYLKNACVTVANFLKEGSLVILQSTVPPKATKDFVIPLLETESGLKCGVNFWLAYCPERLKPGNGLKNLVTNARLVGGFDPESMELAAELLGCFTKGKLWLTDLTTAEVAKVAENTFRYVNIAFANELSFVCKAIGVDVAQVIELANTHPTVNIHKSGCGVGGPCLNKDTQLLLNSIGEENFAPEIILSSIRLNDFMPSYTVNLAVDALKKVGKSIEKSKIAVFGTAYKGEVNDARDSPSKKIIRKLMGLGANVVVYDPYCDECFGAEKANVLLEAVRKADCIVIATDHKVFCGLNLPELKVLMNEKPIIVDGRRIIDPNEAKKQGFVYVAIGYAVN